MSKTSKINTKKQILNESDSDSDISISEGETAIDVGLIDDVEDEELTQDELKLSRLLMRSPFFPSKVGGKPAWLDYSNVPLAVGSAPSSDVSNDSNNNNKQPILLQCDNCKSQLVFLLQIYAPISSNDAFLNQIENIDDAFHRVLYVFLCSNQSCPVEKRTYRVLRSQINRENDFYSPEAPPDELKECEAHLKQFYKNLHEKNRLNLCSVCGLTSSKKCSKCNFAVYCSQNHQLFDWTKLNHKTLCSRYLPINSVDQIIENWLNDENSNEKYTKESNNYVFPEREIIIEPEQIDLKKLKQMDKNFKYNEKEIADKIDSENADGIPDNDLDAIKENDYDKDFDKFKTRSGCEPTQIVRYDRGGKPLWCTKHLKLKDSNVPNCQKCGSHRIFEFQITPQLLNYLNLDLTNHATSIDWAGLYVYTCVKNCQAAHNSYAVEYIYKQDFVS